ncbi:MAG: hypothetical protein N0E38_20200, partial [Candidatus Thiodiazotropha endolucinida]|nr:hypothetical protein [Candidatus Thiodiazotropha taylori]MCW4351247.1 hypothetical protein [Candidatus Thiodiazotropha endolucinida]
TGGRRVQAVQLTASEHGRIAAANMCGFKARYSGSITMNVLDTLGLVSSSFGAWNGVEGGESVTYSLSGNYTYLNLQFNEDKLVGGSCIGNTECLQQLPRLIHAHTPLKEWKKSSWMIHAGLARRIMHFLKRTSVTTRRYSEPNLFLIDRPSNTTNVLSLESLSQNMTTQGGCS